VEGGKKFTKHFKNGGTLYHFGNLCIQGMTEVENRMLRQIFGPKVEVIGGCRKLHSEELHNIFSSPAIIRMLKSNILSWVGHVANVGVMKNSYTVLVRNPEGKRSFK
jgi:hypothetical protein